MFGQFKFSLTYLDLEYHFNICFLIASFPSFVAAVASAFEKSHYPRLLSPPPTKHPLCFPVPFCSDSEPIFTFHFCD